MKRWFCNGSMIFFKKLTHDSQLLENEEFNNGHYKECGYFTKNLVNISGNRLTTEESLAESYSSYVLEPRNNSVMINKNKKDLVLQRIPYWLGMIGIYTVKKIHIQNIKIK